MTRPIYESRCSLCDGEAVESIGTIRLCQKHLDLVHQIAADAKNAKLAARNRRKGAA